MNQYQGHNNTGQLNNFNKEKKTLATIQSIDKTSNQAVSQTAAGQLVFLS